MKRRQPVAPGTAEPDGYSQPHPHDVTATIIAARNSDVPERMLQRLPDDD